MYDAVVVGAGPAGSAVARDIAAAGFKTALLEEHDVIGQPLHCAGLVTPRTLKLAGVGQEVVLNHIQGAFVNTPRRRLPLGGNRVYAVAMDRIQFDRALVQQAQEAGVELFLSTRFLDVVSGPHSSQVVVERRGERLTLKTRLLIGADGVHSRVARALGAQPKARELITGLGIEAKLHLPREDFVEVFVGPNLVPGFFAWIIPLGQGWVRMGLGTRNHRKPLSCLKELARVFPGFFREAEFVRFYGGNIPLGFLDRLCGDRILLVGDAAVQVKPTSGGGIYTGLLAAQHCARVAKEALAQDNLSLSFLRRYEKAWAAEMGQELKRGYDLRRIFLRLGSRQLDLLLYLLANPRLQRLIATYGDIDFPSPLFYRLARIAPLLLFFIRTPPGLSWLRLLKRDLLPLLG